MQLVRALWLASALVPGFVAAVLSEMARLRLAFCAASGGGAIPANLSEFRHLAPGLTMSGHLTGTLIFLPLMALVLFAKGARQLWQVVAISVIWIAAVLIHLGLKIPAICPETVTRPEALSLYIWPAMLGAMILFRVNARRDTSRDTRPEDAQP